MKKIIIYDPYLTGHHVEYIHHLLEYFKESNNDFELYLLVARGFDEKISELVELDFLQSNPRIHIVFIEDLVKKENFIIEQSLNNYKIQLHYLNQFIFENKINHCVFMYLDNAMQIALCTKVGRGIKCSVSGIVLNPFGGFGQGLKKYYYSFRRILQNYLMMSNPKIKGIFIIINKKTASKLNAMHFTNKFIFVSDPILNLNTEVKKNIKSVNSQLTKRITFLLFGSLNKRKGIFKTLQALNLLSQEELGKVKIIFAGKLASEDKSLFLSKFEEIKKRDNDSIEIQDRFISYKEVPMLFSQSDYILLPYDATQASSGILGHAALYKKPILGQGGGIFEQHVKEYGLGKTIADMDDKKLSQLIKNIFSGETPVTLDSNKADNYLKLRSSKFFASQIMNKALS